jgi:rfaE bifunctional protein kinase chain/domain
MTQISKYIDQFIDKRIMVVGDIIADEFIVGRPERLSREAPVLILRRQMRNIMPGGAANAANNIISLQGKVDLVGIVGTDHSGKSLLNILEEKSIDTTGIISDPARPTSLKTRILAGGNQVVKQQVVRIDNLDQNPVGSKIEKNVVDNVLEKINQIDGLLLSDYGNGLFTPSLKQRLIQIGRKHNKFVAVDSRYNLVDFKGATLATPNLEEVGQAVGRELRTQSEVVAAGREIIEELELNYLLITQGSEGMTLFKRDGYYNHIPVANFSEVYDVTGAGDTVIGTMVLALAAETGISSAMKLANYAAGIVVRKSGVATVLPEELRKEVIENEE